MMMMRTPVLAAVALVAALAGALLAWQLARPPETPSLEHATWLTAARPVPPLALTDHLGRDFGVERLRGRWTLVFFGFTHCPDICPTTLATLAAARRQLADLPADRRPGVLFVSVDPGRDTPQLIGRYVGHFDPDFTGATGSAAAIEALTRALGVAVILGAPHEDGSYTVDHSAAVFLVDPPAAVAAVFGTPHVAQSIVEDYRRIVAAARG